ncbi:MAG: hypothetical protein AB1424_16260 [Thermodesulfobacteriota bacterium]
MPNPALSHHFLPRFDRDDLQAAGGIPREEKADILTETELKEAVKQIFNTHKLTWNF